jgi:hypothetical protein
MKFTAAQPFERASIGSLDEVEVAGSSANQGIVIGIPQGESGPWKTQWLEILFNDGRVILVNSPNVKIVSRRRRR